MKHILSVFVFGILCDTGMRLDFQDGKVVLSYNYMYFGYAYRNDDMYKISTTISSSVINKISTFVYSSTLWHNKLGHVNYKKIFSMKKLGLLPNYGGISMKNVKSAHRPRSQRSPFQMLQGA